MSDVKKIIFLWFLIVLSFLIASVWLGRNAFSLFNVAWRILIVVGVYFWGKIRFSFSVKEWIALSAFLVLETLIVAWFRPNFFFLRTITVLFLGPLAEEMFFRGWVISQIKGSHKDKIVKSSLLFGFYHLKNTFILTPIALIYQVFYATFIIGPIFAWARLKYNSLFPSLFLHGLNNLMGATLTERLFPVIAQKRFGVIRK